jgi:DNA-binding CsgD family transcriptional regulator
VRQGDLKHLVEIAYRLDLSEADCIDALARQIAGSFDRRQPSAAFVTRCSRHGTYELQCLATPAEGLATALTRTVEWIPTVTQDQMALGPPIFATSSQVFGPSQMKALRSATGVPEFAGLICPTGRGVLVIGSSRSALLGPTERDRRKWLPIAAHLSSAWRLRIALQAGTRADVAFSPTGKLIDDWSESLSLTARTLLRRAVLRRERMRAANSDELWPALVAGQWILVDRFESSGQRVVVAYRNDSLAAPHQALEPAEAHALRCALDGDANKAIALELRVSEATVSRLIARGLKRLGLRRLTDASELRAMAMSVLPLGNAAAAVDVAVLTRAPHALRPVRLDGAESLTAAERDVLSGVLAGQSHARIAAQRNTSARTIANQIASIFTKLGVQSRRELLARVMA